MGEKKKKTYACSVMSTSYEKNHPIKSFSPVIVCLYTPGLTVLSSTLFTHTTCWKLLLLGSHEITADVDVTWLAFTCDGRRGSSFSLPMTMVQAASLDVLLLAVTDRTLILCGWKTVESTIIVHTRYGRSWFYIKHNQSRDAGAKERP